MTFHRSITGLGASLLLLVAACSAETGGPASSADSGAAEAEETGDGTPDSDAGNGPPACEVPLAADGICHATCAHLCGCGLVTDLEDCPAPCAIYASIASSTLAEEFEACVLGIPCDEITANTAVECILAGVAPSAEGEALCALLEEHMSACLFTDGFRQTAGLFCLVHVSSHADLSPVESCVALAMEGPPPGNFNPPPISSACADLEACVKDVLGLGMHPAWAQ